MKRNQGHIQSIRFTAAELAAINRWVAQTGRRFSDFVHEAVAQHTMRPQRPTVQVSAPAGSRLYLYGVGPEATWTSGGQTLYCGNEATST